MIRRVRGESSKISIHALREEGDLHTLAVVFPPCDFYPRPPRGGRPNFSAGKMLSLKFLSTPSARRATSHHQAGASTNRISIHALREEGDSFRLTKTGKVVHFYPRPPRGGRRIRSGALNASNIFLSTPSARRATSHFRGSGSSGGNFYPRPPRGGRRLPADTAVSSTIFLSTPSARRATHPIYSSPHTDHISIHALREEGDRMNTSSSLSSK